MSPTTPSRAVEVVAKTEVSYYEVQYQPGDKFLVEDPSTARWLKGQGAVDFASDMPASAVVNEEQGATDVNSRKAGEAKA